MTLEELRAKMKPGEIYYFSSKKTMNDDPEANPVYSGDCRVSDDGIKCRIVCTNEPWPDDEKRPNARHFTIKTDEELEPWEFDLE